MTSLEFENKIKEEGLMRDFLWVKGMYDSNKLRIESSLMTEAAFNDFKLLVRKTQEVFENSWDIDFKVEDGDIYIYGVVIHFPELEIRNSRGKTHNIKDLFVRVNLYMYGKLKIGGLSGGRTTMTYEEVCSSYIHSHLPYSYRPGSGIAPYWSDFCLGSGHINDFLASINSEGMSETNITSFLLQIISLVSWESLEGVPHRYMSSIRGNSNSGRLYHFSPQHAENAAINAIDYYKRNRDDLPQLTVLYEPGKYHFVIDENFKKFLLGGLNQRQQESILCYEASPGNYYQYGYVPNYSTPPNTDNAYYLFRGEKKMVTITLIPEQVEVKHEDYIIHPEYLTTVKNKLEYDINVKKIRKSTIDRYQNKDGNVRESAESN